MLLQQIGIVPDQVVSPDIDETPARDELPRPYAERMARGEGGGGAMSPDHLVLAADTVVAAGRRILPKAEDAAAGPCAAWRCCRAAATGC